MTSHTDHHPDDRPDDAAADLGLRDRLDRLMGDEPPHRTSLTQTRARGRDALRRRRTAVAGGAGAVLAIATLTGLGAAALPHAQHAPTRQVAPAADPTPTPTTDPTGPTTDLTSDPTSDPSPTGRASYTYSLMPACPLTPGSDPSSCHGYTFLMDAKRPAVVAAVELRLSDGSEQKVPTHDGSYRIRIDGTLQPGYHWGGDGALYDGDRPTDLFAGITLLDSEGHVLGSATATDSDGLKGYLEICDRLSPGDSGQCADGSGS